MFYLFIKNCRDFMQKPWRLIGLIASISLGIGIFGAVKLALNSVVEMTEVFYAETEFADIEFTFLSDDKENVPTLNDIPGVKSVEYRLILPGKITKKDKSTLSGLMILSEGIPKINTLKLAEGKLYDKNKHDFVVEKSLQKIHNFSSMDTIEMKIGEKIMKGVISGIAISPEFLCMSSNPNFSNPEKGTLGVIFGDLSYFNDALGFTLVNDIVVKINPGADELKIKEMILERLSGLNIDKVFTKQNQFSNQQFIFYLRLVNEFSDFLILVFLILTCFVSLLTCKRFITEQRKEFGALLAIGYSLRRILLSNAIVASIIGFISGIFGCFFASIIMIAFTASFCYFLGFPFVKNYFDVTILLVCVLLAVLIAVISLCLPLFMLLRQTPTKIIRQPPVEKVSFESFLKYNFYKTGYGAIGFSFGIRNLLRKPLMTCFSIFVIAGAIGLSIAYGIVLASFYNGVDRSLGQEKWDACIDFHYPVFQEDIDQVRKNLNFEQVSPYFRGTVEVGKDGKFKDSRILGYVPSDSVREVNLLEGRMFKAEGNEGIISRDICEPLNISIGDMVELRYQGETDSLKVVGITADLNVVQILTNIDKARSLMGFESRSNGVFVRLKNTNDQLMNQNSRIIAKTTTLTHLTNVVQKNMDDLIIILYIIWAYSLVMIIVFLLMFVNLSIEEKKPEYATLLSLGFDNKSISKIMFSEIFPQILLAILVSIPLGIVIGKILNYKTSASFFEAFLTIRIKDVAIPVFVSIIPAIVSGFISTMVILKMNVVSVLRGRDIN